MAPASLALRGTLVHCPALRQVEILQDHLLRMHNSPIIPSPRLTPNCSVTDNRGFIIHLAPFSSESSQKHIDQCESSIKTLPAGSFLFPTFCDLHLHAPQFMYQGTGLDLPLMEWLDNYAYKAEEGLDQDPHLAAKVYHRLAQRLIEVGTGAVLLFGTIKTETK